MLKRRPQAFGRSLFEVSEHPVDTAEVDTWMGRRDRIGLLPSALIGRKPLNLVSGQLGYP
ncbi:MAG: hypothetical protein JOZ69_12385 [Myxococcales bacterium]|nr:hypothetical protein [Myxococcales bacterium]